MKTVLQLQTTGESYVFAGKFQDLSAAITSNYLLCAAMHCTTDSDKLPVSCQNIKIREIRNKKVYFHF